MVQIRAIVLQSRTSPTSSIGLCIVYPEYPNDYLKGVYTPYDKSMTFLAFPNRGYPIFYLNNSYKTKNS